jgi:hypothetical protein
LHFVLRTSYLVLNYTPGAILIPNDPENIPSLPVSAILSFSPPFGLILVLSRALQLTDKF